MIEKLVTIPVKAGYKVGRAGLGVGAKAGKGFWSHTKNYFMPVLQGVDDIDYSKLESRRKNKDIKEFLEKNPEARESLEECINKAADKHRVARRWAGAVDTVDKATAPLGLGACWLILNAGTGFTLGLVEELAELAAVKGPFMAYYAKKTGKKGLKRIPGFLAYEFFTHVFPFGDFFDLRNNYVKSVDKDIESYAANLFREKQGIEKPKSWLTRLWKRDKKISPTTTTPASSSKEQEDDKMLEPIVRKMPDPFYVENRVKMYMNGLEQGSYENFMKEKHEDLPQELERFVQWGFNPRKDPKWYTSSIEYNRNAKEISDIADKFLGEKADKKYRQITSAHELNIAGEKKYVIEFSNATHESYREANDVKPGMMCPQVMLIVTRDYKLIVDAKTGRIEDSRVKKKAYHANGVLDPIKPLPYNQAFDKEKLLKTSVPVKVAEPSVSEDYKKKAVNAA